MPLTIRDDASTAAYVLQNSVTTWQAYNLWGDYSLYYGRTASGGQDFADRARIVSFDRPYPQTWASGAADFVGNELPLLFHLESLGLDLTYWTDVDLHTRPQLLANHRCLFSLGHDEYWSQPMRQAAAQAQRERRQPGLPRCQRRATARSAWSRARSGPIAWRSATRTRRRTPWSREQPELTTVNWAQAPVDQPESTLIGSMYQSVHAKADMVVTDASSWFYDGCNLTDGQTFPNMILGEYDRYVPAMPGPRNVDVLAHSPVPGQSNWSDVTYYTAAGQRGRRAGQRLGELRLHALDHRGIPSLVIPGPFPGITEVVRRAMENVYGRFGLGPATSYGSSGGNWTEVYTGAAAAGRLRGRHRIGLIGRPAARLRSWCMPPLAGAAPLRSNRRNGEHR